MQNICQLAVGGMCGIEATTIFCFGIKCRPGQTKPIFMSLVCLCKKVGQSKYDPMETSLHICDLR